jgi:D-sedoheptulose 7-phosphate isomerase
MEPVQEYISALQRTMDQVRTEAISDVIATLQRARLQGNRVFIMGNGGSATTASHFVCDLAKNTRRAGLPHFQVIGLTDNMAIFSAYANDEGYENAFSQQLESLVGPGDVVTGISASGNSRNVLNAIEVARSHRATTIGFTGFDGGQLRRMVDISIHVQSSVIEHVEDIHLMVEHIIVKTIKEQIPPRASITPALLPLPADLSAD